MLEVLSNGGASPKFCHICYANPSTETPDPNVPVRDACIRCGRPFCLGHSSAFNPSACEECIKDVSVTESVFEKTETDYDVKRDRLVVHTQRCKQIDIAGEDWVWHQRRVQSLSDLELKTVIQLHKAVVSMIETELTERQVKQFNKLQGTVVPGMGVAIKSTVTKQTTRTLKPKAVDASKLADSIRKLGLDPDQIKKLLESLSA